MDERLLVEYSDSEPKETNLMLHERLLPLGEAGDKDVFESPIKKNSLLDFSLEISPTTSTRKIKPVSKMTVMNDNVRRVTLPDGTPAPEPHVNHPIQIDIVLWLPVLYVSWALGSLALAVFILFVIGGEPSVCSDKLTSWTFTIFGMVLLSTLMSCVASAWLCVEGFQRRRTSSFETYRILLRRFILVTRTTQKKQILVLAVLCDILSLITSFVGLPVFAESVPICDFAF